MSFHIEDPTDEEIVAILDALIDNGVPLQKYIERLNAKLPPSEKALRCIEHARAALHRDGETEFDEPYCAADGVDPYGCYVMAWVWVYDPAYSPQEDE
jgi:hypothetical protein